MKKSSDNKQHKAFSLAEVMIAMAVVAIAAAIVVPTFVSNMHGKTFRTKYMKTISNLVQAATASYANESYDFGGANGYYGEVGAPQATHNIPGGALDGSLIGLDTPDAIDVPTHSDLYRETGSLFHIFHDYLSLRHTATFTNYAVMPADIGLNCAGRATDGKTVALNVPGRPSITSATIKNNFLAREYWAESIVQGSGGLADLCNGRSLEQGGLNQGRMFMMDDGSVFTYDPAQAYCLESNPCYGYIDINGSEGPNRVIACSKGEDSYITSYSKNALPGMLVGDCTVKMSDVTDIYPVLFYNQVMKPASWAAKSVYFKLESNQVPEDQTADVENTDVTPQTVSRD